MTENHSHTCLDKMLGKEPKVYTYDDVQHIISAGHRAWLDSCCKTSKAAIKGIAELNEYGV